MPRFYINEKEITSPPGMTTFNQILAYIDEEVLPPNSIVRMVRIDGTPLLNENLSRDSIDINSQISSSEKVEIVTGTEKEIICDSISETLEYLDRVEEGIPPLALQFQSDPGRGAFEGLRQLYEGLYWLNLLLDNLSSKFEIIFDDRLIQELPGKEHKRKYISILKQLQDAQERGDMVLISDLLEFEIAPMVPVWKEMFQIISERAVLKQ